VTADDVDEEVADAIRAGLAARAANVRLPAVLADRLVAADGPLGRRARRGAHLVAGRVRPARGRTVRLVEKTPKNCLRIGMVDAIFPDALFVRIRREPLANTVSVLRGWREGGETGPDGRPRFARHGYRLGKELGLADHDGAWWRFALIPGWRDLRGATVADVAAHQVAVCGSMADEGLAAVPAERRHDVLLPELRADPARVLGELLEWAGLRRDAATLRMAARLPEVNVSRPRADGRADRDEAAAALERLPDALRGWVADQEGLFAP